jgi:ribosomal RNA-processing protein 36
MAPAKLLNRNVRPSRPQPEDEDDFDMSEDGAQEEDADSAADFDDESEDDGEEAPEEDEDEEEDVVDAKLETVSFGALKQAQDALSRKRKRKEETNPAQDEKLEKIRERLRQIKRRKESEAEPETKSKKKQTSKKSGNKDESAHDQNSDSDSDSGPEEVGATSKHAPMAQSSRYEVTRKRQVIDVPKMKARDPRFDAMQQRNAHTGNVDKAYGFLAEYQADEIAELKTAMKTMNDPFQKDILKRKIGAMENRIKAKAAKEETEGRVRQKPLLLEEERAQGASAGGEIQEHEGQGPREGDRQEAQEGESEGDQEDARRKEDGGLKIVHSGYANTSIGGRLAVNDTMIPFSNSIPVDTTTLFSMPSLPFIHLTSDADIRRGSGNCFELGEDSDTCYDTHDCCLEPRERLKFDGCPHSNSLTSIDETDAYCSLAREHQSPTSRNTNTASSTWLRFCVDIAINL